ncbi:MAG: hypothetical protein JXA81_13555 [Sedimentisphaerales bacterium]|nr:hypothetical protein [Sedimentisphaerales bacterium]
MTISEFRNLLGAQPFRPFAINLADGRSIPVKHREFVLPSPSGRTVIVYQPDDSFGIIDMLLVTSLTVNGKKRSERKQS